MSCCKEDHVRKKTSLTNHPANARAVTGIKLKCQHNCESCRAKRDKKTGATLKGAAVILFAVMPLAAGAQDAVPASRPAFWADPVHHPDSRLYFILFSLAIVVGLAMAVMLIAVRALRLFSRELEISRAQRIGVPYVPPAPWWSATWEKINALRPIENEKELELDHDYDGIRELDNHLPPWWKGLFYCTIAFGVVYLLVFHVFYVFPLPAGEYRNELTLVAEQQRLLKASAPAETIDEKTLIYSKDDALITRGKIVFTSNNCGSCHRNDGGGNIGPNLTDEYWLHGGNAPEIFVTIRDGFIDKGMPAWGKVMSLKDVKALTFYVMSLEGSNPPNAKKAQGDRYVPAALPPKADTVLIQASLQ